MEDIFPLIAVVLIYAVTHFIKKAFPDGTQESDEVFPPIEVLEPEEEAPVQVAGANAVPADTARRTAPSQGRSATPARAAHKAGEGRRTTVDVDTAGRAEERGKRFSLKGKSEARRAFIYSEIFGRKYQ